MSLGYEELPSKNILMKFVHSGGMLISVNAWQRFLQWKLSKSDNVYNLSRRCHNRLCVKDNRLTTLYTINGRTELLYNTTSSWNIN